MEGNKMLGSRKLTPTRRDILEDKRRSNENTITLLSSMVDEKRAEKELLSALEDQNKLIESLSKELGLPV